MSNEWKEVTVVAEVQVGVVQKFFAKPSVAAIEVTGDQIAVGDTLWFKGHTSDFRQQVESMQEEKETITRAVKGQVVGIQVKERVREHDLVYKVTE
jgi:putative protease